MSVLDAAVVADALVGAGRAGRQARSALREQDAVEAPAILPAEVGSALRAMTMRGDLDARRAESALLRLTDVAMLLHDFRPFATRVWALRANLTVYDAWYVALAERLDVPLLTADARLAAASGPRCQIVLLPVGTTR